MFTQSCDSVLSPSSFRGESAALGHFSVFIFFWRVDNNTSKNKYSTRREFYGYFYHTECGNLVFTGTLGIFPTLVYVFTMRVVINDILSMAIIPTLSTSILFCNLCFILLWISTRSVVKIATKSRYSKLVNIKGVVWRFCTFYKDISGIFFTTK